jgi:hypothetical protein
MSERDPQEFTITMTRAQALALGLLRCSCGHPPNNHFDFNERACAHCPCKRYDEHVMLPRVS